MNSDLFSINVKLDVIGNKVRELITIIIHNIYQALIVCTYIYGWPRDVPY